ncbi:antitoxin [Sulfurisphaera javensis]|uniref:Antitoxin n=1 Tax=Sulfurisphaera javensis TaxID=2049879 RepID=A0AAT9GSQ0_9CREN
MSDVISVRISRKLKKELEELGINYTDAVRSFLEELVRKEKIKKSLEEAKKIRESLKGRTFIPSSTLIREDRDENNS